MHCDILVKHVINHLVYDWYKNSPQMTSQERMPFGTLLQM
jgi:hypothetical protein